MFLKPRSIRKGEGIGRSDVALKRINITEEPLEYYLVYIDNGELIVANADYEHHTTFTNRYTLGAAIDCAIEFDCRWIYVEEEDKYEIATIGEPFVFKVTPGGALVSQQGKNGIPYELCSGSVRSVSAIRGWRNTSVESSDQGLICAYIKNDRKVYYRTYATQEDGSVIWEPEVLVEAFATPVDSLTLFRTNDYRVGFLVESAGQIVWALTNRNWSSMSIKDENIGVSSSLNIGFIPIVYKNGETEENIKVKSSLSIELIYASPIRYFTSIGNTTDTNIIAYLDHDITSVNISDFTIEDDYGLAFIIEEVNLVEPKCIQIKTSTLNFANQPTNGVGSLTLKYKGNGMKGLIGQIIEPFTTSFIPKNLTFVKLEPPMVVEVFNEEVQ